jgi:hypothetical protein
MTSSEPLPPPDPTASAEPAPTRHPTASVVLGAATAAWDRLTPRRDRGGLRTIAVGAVFEAEDTAGRLLARLLAGPRQRPVPGPGMLLDRARQGVVRLAERGAVEEDLGRRRAADMVESLVRAVATATVVERVVDAQVDRLLRPLVATVLDDVLAQLENDPERVQALIRGQRDSMVNELMGRLQQSTAAGDAAVDRITGKLIRRSTPAPVPPTTPG